MYSRNPASPKVFISYSHDSREYINCVLELSDRLRAEGVDCNLDQYELSPAEGWPRWMENEIQNAKFALVICTETYKRRARGEEAPGIGHGVRWECHLTYQQLYNAGTLNNKFIPVLLESGKFEDIPEPLQGATFYYAHTEEGYEALYRHLTDQPRSPRPDLGKRVIFPPLEPKPAFHKFFAFERIIDIIKDREKKEIDVISISANNYDVFIKVDKICPEHEAVIIDEPFPCAGGSGANTVCGLSKLGKKTAIVGCIKNDPEGIKLFESFNNFLVDRELLIKKDDTAYPNQKTGSTVVLVEESSGKRQILVTSGINNCLSEILRADNETLLKDLVEKVRNSKILHLSSFARRDEMKLQLDVLEQIRDDNIIVSLTPGAIYVAEGLNELKRILACTDIMFLYIQQLDRLLARSKEIKNFKSDLSLQEKVDLFFDWRIKKRITHPMIVVIREFSETEADNLCKNQILVADNFGNTKSFFAHSNEKFNQGKPLIPEDTTGTGDALAAGFLYGILEGKDIEICVDFGFIMLTNVSQKLGARTNFLEESSLKEKLEFLRSNK